MEDIVPSLYKNIYDNFYRKVKNDKDIQNILNGKNKEASFTDVSLLSGRLGVYASTSLTKYITKDNMPDGKLYWNILERTILPIMEDVHKLVNDLAVKVQLLEDAKQSIGIKPLRTEFNKERIETIMNKLMALQNEVLK